MYDSFDQVFLIAKVTLTILHFFSLTDFLQWQVVTGMEAEQIIESLANYIWSLRVANAVCISHLLLIDRRALCGFVRS